MRNWNLYKRTITTVFFLLIISAANSYTQDMPVPANLQAALFKKIFSFDKTLQAKGNYEVVVLGSGSNDIVSAFKAVGINAKPVDQVPSSASVVYVMPGAASTKAFTSQNGILSVSGAPSLVEGGKVAIGIGTEGGKPKILINVAQLKAEKHEMSAELLNIAKLLQ